MIEGTVASSRSGINEYELHDHRPERTFQGNVWEFHEFLEFSDIYR